MKPQQLAVPITADPWGEAKDLEALHAETTQAIIDSVEALRVAAALGAAEPGRPMPILVLGTAGIGKTHLFSRLRRKLGKHATLVHIRPITGADMSPRYILGQVLQQLARSSGGIRQIDSLVGSILSLEWDGSPDDSAVGLDLLRNLDEQGRRGNLEHFLSRLLERMPDLDDGYLELLLNAPFLDSLSLRSTLAWLGGQDISETQAARIGIQKPLAEDRILPALRTLARVASRSAPLVVVFDQLENLIQGEEPGRIQAYGNLMMDLVDEVRDLVIVQMALESEWERGIRPVLSLAQQARTIGSRFVLEMPAPEEVEGLIRLWMSEYPDPPAPFPWPFTVQEIGHLAAQSPTPRMLLQELQHRLAGAPVLSSDSREAGSTLLTETWEEGLRKARVDIDERDALEQGAAPDALADGLIHLVRLLPSLTLRGSQGPERLQIATPSGELHVALIHQAHHRSIATALERLGAIQGMKLGLREHWRPLRPTRRATRGKWSSLVQRADVGWHWLERKDVERLLALDALLKSAVSRDISGPEGVPFEPSQVEAWVCQELLPQEWPVARALVAGNLAQEEEPQANAESPCEAGHMKAIPVSDGADADPGGERDSLVMRKLRCLRVASVDRLQKECGREGEGVPRAVLLRELEKAGSTVTWIGEHIVCLER